VHQLEIKVLNIHSV